MESNVEFNVLSTERTFEIRKYSRWSGLTGLHAKAEPWKEKAKLHAAERWSALRGICRRRDRRHYATETWKQVTARLLTASEDVSGCSGAF